MTKATTALQQWKANLDKAANGVQALPARYHPEAIIEEAEWLLASALTIAGVACKSCGGFGHKAYGSTATWRGGIGGQAITRDVCDVCWGTGRVDAKGPDLRQLRRGEQK